MRKTWSEYERFLAVFIGPVVWSLANPISNVYKSTKSDLLTCLENKISLVSQITTDVARVCDGVCIIIQLTTGFDTFGELSDSVLKRITSNTSAQIFSMTDQYWKVSIKSCERNRWGRNGSIRVKAMRPAISHKVF